MALSNFSLPFGGLVAPIQPWGVTLAPPLHPAHQLATNTNNLLYAPAEHQQQSTDELPPPVGSDYYKNNPYAHPQLHQSHQPSQQQHKQVFQFGTQIHNNNNNANGRRKGGNTYLPPIPPPGARNSQHFQHHQQQQQQHQFNQQQQQQQQRNTYNTNVNNELYKTATGSTSSSSSSSSLSSSSAATSSLLSSTTATQVRTYGEGTYSHYPTADSNEAVIQPQQQPQQQQYYNKFNDGSSLLSNTRTNTYSSTQQQQRRPATTYGASTTSSIASSDNNNSQNINNADSNKNKKNTNINENEGETDLAEDGSFPIRPPGFTRVQAGQGSRTQVHAVLDYDVEEGEEDDYYDAEDHGEQVNGGKLILNNPRLVTN